MGNYEHYNCIEKTIPDVGPDFSDLGFFRSDFEDLGEMLGVIFK